MDYRRAEETIIRVVCSIYTQMINEETAKQRAKKEIARLINLYESIKNEKDYTETDAETKLVAPLFEALGWNMSGKLKGSFVAQRKKQQDERLFPDFTVKIRDRTQFFIEAKALGFDGLHYKRDFVKQAIGYGWNAGISWVVLTNFKELVIYNADWGFKDELQNRFWKFKYTEFLERFEDLWKLSFYAFPRDELNKEAEKAGKRAKRIRIDTALLKDLLTWRDKLIKNLRKNNDFSTLPEGYDEELVQTILDRMIFIRFTEDRQHVDPQLKRLLRANYPIEFTAIKMLAKIFKQFDEWYNSELFHGDFITARNLKISNKILLEIVRQLYENKNGLPYIFSQVDADVLGNLYENYIEQIQKKEEGIYYTPTYIVKYIVDNTVGELLKHKRPEEIKILDPACGSGSFLINALSKLKAQYDDGKDHYQESLSAYTEVSDKQFKRDIRLLKNSIYGMDKDPKAVSIARLNLLLRAAEKKAKLPNINDNIQWGDSLIDDREILNGNIQLAKSFEERFSTIMKTGFDIVIGNPPYVFTRDVEFSDSFKKYIQESYLNASESTSKSHARQSGKINLYSLFIIKAVSLLKEGGTLGFIIPNNLLRTTTYDIVRKFILDNCNILQIIDLGPGVFKGVTASTIIVLLQKECDKKKRDTNKTLIISDIENFERTNWKTKKIQQSEFLKNTSYAFNITLDMRGRKLFDKVEKDSEVLGDVMIIHAGGIATGPNKKKMISDYKINNTYKPMLEGKDIKPFYPVFADRWIRYEKKLLYRARDESIFLSPEKLITQRIGGGDRVVVVSYDNQKYYTFNSTNTLLIKDKSYNIKYILSLLNSKLLNWYYVNKFTNRSTLTVNISKTFLEQLPIRKSSSDQQRMFIKLADKMLDLNKQLQKLKDVPGQERDFIEKEIDITNREINKKVYKLYDLTEAEKKSVEDSLK